MTTTRICRRCKQPVEEGRGDYDIGDRRWVHHECRLGEERELRQRRVRAEARVYRAAGLLLQTCKDVRDGLLKGHATSALLRQLDEAIFTAEGDE